MPYEQIGKNEPVCIADEVPFEIPESWEWVRLSFISQLHDGKKCINNNLPILSARFLRGKEENKTINSGKLVAKGTKIILVDGENSGEVFVTPCDGYLGSTFKILWTSESIIEDYLQYFLLMHKDALKNSKRGAAIPHLNKDLFFGLLLPIPPIEEQIRIVRKIKELVPYIDYYGISKERLHELNNSFPEQLKKSILQYAVQGKLVQQDPNDEPASVLLERIREEKQHLIAEGKIKRDKHESVIYRRDNSHYEKLDGIERCIDDEIPFEIPESWAWIRLSKLVIKDIKRGKAPKYVDNGLVFVFAQKCNTKAGNINMSLAKFLDEEHFMKYPETEYMQDGDIIINSTGGGTMGRVGIFYDADRITNAPIVPDSHVTIVRPYIELDNEYLYFVIKYYQPVLEKQGEGSTNQTELKPETIGSLFIPVPPLAEQTRISTSIQKLFTLQKTL